MADIKIGDRVIMNNKYLVSEKDKGKTWTVRSNPWNCCGTIVVLLEGKSGGYAIVRTAVHSVLTAALLMLLVALYTNFLPPMLRL